MINLPWTAHILHGWGVAAHGWGVRAQQIGSCSKLDGDSQHAGLVKIKPEIVLEDVQFLLVKQNLPAVSVDKPLHFWSN